MYEEDADLEQVKYLRKVLNLIHDRRFYFSSRTYKFSPIKKEDIE